MQLSRRSDYALRALIYLATRREGEVTGLPEISRAAKVSRPFLAKILNTLAKRGLVKSHRGIHGGFALARSPSEISFLEVLHAVDGPMCVNLCVGRQGRCDAYRGCLMNPAWHHIQSEIEQVLRSRTIADVLAGRTLPRPDAGARPH